MATTKWRHWMISDGHHNIKILRISDGHHNMKTLDDLVWPPQYEDIGGFMMATTIWRYWMIYDDHHNMKTLPTDRDGSQLHKILARRAIWALQNSWVLLSLSLLSLLSGHCLYFHHLRELRSSAWFYYHSNDAIVIIYTEVLIITTTTPSSSLQSTSSTPFGIIFSW